MPFSGIENHHKGFIYITTWGMISAKLNLSILKANVNEPKAVNNTHYLELIES